MTADLAERTLTNLRKRFHDVLHRIPETLMRPVLLALAALIFSTACAAEKTLTIWWAQWAPADGLQQLGDVFTKQTGIKINRVDADDSFTHRSKNRAPIIPRTRQRLARQVKGIHRMPSLHKVRSHAAAHIAETYKSYFHVPYPIVGMTKALPPSGEPSGQRWVMVLTLVQNFTPSMPCWLVSPKADRFQPPKL